MGSQSESRQRVHTERRIYVCWSRGWTLRSISIPSLQKSVRIDSSEFHFGTVSTKLCSLLHNICIVLNLVPIHFVIHSLWREKFVDKFSRNQRGDRTRDARGVVKLTGGASVIDARVPISKATLPRWTLGRTMHASLLCRTIDLPNPLPPCVCCTPDSPC